jgi:acetyl-CoA C-acetyltransferase
MGSSLRWPAVPLDPRTPVIVGVGQVSRRLDRVEDAVEPAVLMAEAARLAADDSGAADLLRRIQSVRVVDVLSWRYADPGAAVSQHLGVEPQETAKTTTGGNSPQMLVNATATSIQAGELDVALLVGAEAMYSRRLARRADHHLEWPKQGPETPPPRVLGSDRSGSHEVELARSLAMPTQVYPVFENALRGAAGETIDQHQVKVSELWSRFSEVAATNPYAWLPEVHTPEQIRSVGPDNRMIGFPYPKLMNANMQVDQSAALIVTSVAAARAAGVPADRWVFPLSGADGNDHYFVSERDNLHSSPAIAACGRHAFELAGIGVDDVAHVDLYSCFPSAVQIGAAALGIGLDRQLTVTGGLCFGGGPGNNYVTHAIATLVGRLRDDPGSYGLATALGWYVTKHAVGIYSTAPPGNGFRAANVQAEVDALPRRELAADHDGEASLESYTVVHDRDGNPSLAIVACLLPDGRRAWANSDDADLMKTLTTDEVLGRPVRVRTGGHVELT